ncbi:putative inactive leucine-rich repeat receptor-like protein kinase [Acorus gramineus]|uniref:Inactive leucine-rich repeat receptor-like protein kinase n=1 Tax=Acorus gramineus TaxID=55184 RepID=A0AAV9AJF9_ACOGR|nr:putative inactive leucine-rich repeat receptor-like protein kinase [Acorus gramineus]
MSAAAVPLLLLLFLFSSSSVAADPQPQSDASALALFKSSFDHPDSVLPSWSPGSPPCNATGPSWAGVICFQGIVTGLHLGNMGLSGNVDAAVLSRLLGLRVVSLVHNRLAGPIPAFNRLGALKALYLSDNNFSGDIPRDYFAGMSSLKKVWLSGNSFTGGIPLSLAKLEHLMELHLENNMFSGTIPADVPWPEKMVSFDVANNRLEGKVPKSLSRFNLSSFDGNQGLCGSALGRPCKAESPELAPEDTSDAVGSPAPDSGKMAATAAAMILLLLALLAAVAVVKRRREAAGAADFNALGSDNGEDGEVDVHQPSSHHQTQRHGSSRKGGLNGSEWSGGGGGGGGGVGELVVLNREKGVFGLGDLMKAAAEVLGNGGLGSAYKAVMANGTAVVVKRVREMNNRGGREEFEAEMRRLGRLRHRNLLPVLAYHYRREEKLLILEYVPNGTLLYLLHGDRGSGHGGLDWPRRQKIIRGVARGMSYLHSELSQTHTLPHGNLKSGNVLLSSDFDPLLTDYGLHPLVTPSVAPSALLAFHSPESHNPSPKSDVYCLGILVLEILTGKFPSVYLGNNKGGIDVAEWVASAAAEGREAELFDPQILVGASKAAVADMERLVRVGSACAEADPDRRPDMREAARRIEEITGGETSSAAGFGGELLRRESLNERSGRRDDGDGFGFAIS